MSFGTGLRMDASAAPSISQRISTSHSASPFDSSSASRASGVRGTACPKTAASAGQNRFCGCP